MSQFSDRAVEIPSFQFREDHRAAEGYAAFSGVGASDYQYEHHVIDGRIVLVRGARRASVPVRDEFRRVAVLPERCTHGLNGTYVPSCGYCAWRSRPDRQPVKRDQWHPTLADLDLALAEPIAA